MSGQSRRFRNFRKSMQLLIPALFFLGSSCEVSRGLGYRQPSVESRNNYNGSKYHAIAYHEGAVEFRVFETCYDKPEVILDNVVVMANCMRYWRRSYLSSGLENITGEITFGNDQNHNLERFYTSTAHIDLLNAGLRKLKPAYYTLQAVKKQRNFTLSKQALHDKMEQYKEDYRREYAEYVERFEWDLGVKRQYLIYDYLTQSRTQSRGLEEATQAAELKVGQLVAQERAKMKPMPEYIADRINSFMASTQGQWRLSINN